MNNLANESKDTNNSISRLIQTFYDEIISGPGTKQLIKILISPIGLLGIVFLIISIFLGFIDTPQANNIKSILWFVFLFIALAESWNIIGGYAGEVDFGHVLFLGVGVYTEAILINQYNAMSWFSFLGNNVFTIYLTIFLTILLSGLSTVVIAIIIGLPILRLKGAYFAIAMLALSQVFLILFLQANLFPFYQTNGGNITYVTKLLRIIPNYTLFVYILIIGVSIVAFIITHYVSYTRLGLSLRAIKGSPDGASSIGINVLKTKLQAFALSAFIAGIAGAVYMLYFLSITPEPVFDTQITVQMIIMTLLGGSASVFGPVIGALIIYPIRNILTQNLSGFAFTFGGIVLNFDVAYLIIYGLIFVFAVLYLPNGIIGYLEKKGILKRESLIDEDQIKEYKNKGGKNNG